MTWLSLSRTGVTDLSPVAGLGGLTWLSLSRTGVTDLSPVTGLAGLAGLTLSGTGVTDLSPVAGLTGLVGLFLWDTGVTDLSPLRGLSRLAEDPSVLGLRFADTPATRADADLAGIADISDNAARARALFDWLDRRPPPAVPEPDPFLPVAIAQGRLEIAVSTPTEAERDERLKQALHLRLRDKAAALAVAAGNRFPRLAVRARAVAQMAEPDFAALDMLGLHLELDDLAQRAETGAEEGEAFPPEVAEALGDVLRIGPGLTLDNPDVETLLDRQARMRAAPPPADVQALQDALTERVAADDQAIGAQLRDLETRLMLGVERATRDAVQKALHRNLLWKIGVLGVGFLGGVA